MKIEFLAPRPLPRWLIAVNIAVWVGVFCSTAILGWLRYERERQALAASETVAATAITNLAHSQATESRMPDIDALRRVLSRSQVTQASGLAELEAVHVDGVRLRSFTLDNDFDTLAIELVAKDAGALQDWLDAINEGQAATRLWRVTEYVSNTQSDGILAVAARTPQAVPPSASAAPR